MYTVEPKTATFPCVHFEVATSPTEKKTSLLYVSILSHFEIVEIVGPIWFAQSVLKGIFSWVCFLPFAGKHRSRTVRNPLSFLLFPPALCLVQSLKAISWIVNCIRNGLSNLSFLVHNILMLENGKLWCWLWMIDILIALLCMQVLTRHSLLFNAIFALKFRLILTKDFNSSYIKNFSLKVWMGI